MASVYIFISTGRFSSFEQMRKYIDETYTEDGDGVPSEFMNEVGLESYEPACIEAMISKTGAVVPIAVLLAGSSWSEQWVQHLPADVRADSAICVFDPNRLLTPEASSLRYLGEYEFEARQSEWFAKTFGRDA